MDCHAIFGPSIHFCNNGPFLAWCELFYLASFVLFTVEILLLTFDYIYWTFKLSNRISLSSLTSMKRNMCMVLTSSVKIHLWYWNYPFSSKLNSLDISYIQDKKWQIRNIIHTLDDTYNGKQKSSNHGKNGLPCHFWQVGPFSPWTVMVHSRFREIFPVQGNIPCLGNIMLPKQATK